jgi:hypothetical protein
VQKFFTSNKQIRQVRGEVGETDCLNLGICTNYKKNKMGYPTIDKFDIKFIERTKEYVKKSVLPNTFTHLINSLVGLIFIPNEFHKKGKRTYVVDFLNKPISEYQKLSEIFSGEVTLSNELGEPFQQLKFFRKNSNNNRKTIEETTVGNLVRLFRDGIAHSNITPIAEGVHWSGIIVKNFENHKKEDVNDFNFEVYLNQHELNIFATFIADEYLNNAHTSDGLQPMPTIKEAQVADLS